MSFIVAAASTAAVSAVSAGAITGGVAGAVAAGSIGATLAGVGAAAATAGAIGAGVGAIGAAATGQDVGKGALMGAATGAVTGGVGSGLGGAAGALGGAAGTSGVAATGIGAAAGAAGGAAGAAAGGENVGTGALYGGIIGGVGGAMSTGTPAEGVTTPQAGEAVVPTASPNGIGSINAPAPTDALTPQGLASIPSTPTTTTGAINEALPTAGQFSPTVAGDSYGIKGVQGYTPSVDAPVVAPVTDSSISLQKGFDLIKDHPGEAMQVAGLGIGALGSPQQEEQKLQPINTTNYLSPNFQRYDATPVYADGGAVGYEPSVGMYTGAANGYADGGMPQQAPQGPMNPIVARAMAAAQQNQQAQQVQQPQPIAPQQGIPLQQPMQPQPMQPMQPSPQQGIPLQQQPIPMANGGITDGYSLGGYAHGGNPRLLKGPGSGISDDIPATIGHDGKQPARLATGEFVVPARIVSELGSGDTDAGGKVLQQMVDRIQARRAKTVGKGKVAADSKSHKVLPA